MCEENKESSYPSCAMKYLQTQWILCIFCMHITTLNHIALKKELDEDFLVYVERDKQNKSKGIPRINKINIEYNGMRGRNDVFTTKHPSISRISR